MKRKYFSLLIFVVSILLVSCGSMSTALKVHPVNIVDSVNVATLSYSGSSTSMKINLFKVNGKPRTDYLEKTMFWSYLQTGSLGFSVEVPVGENTFELINSVKKEIVTMTLNLQKKPYKFDFTNDYKVYELDAANNKKEIPVKIEKVKPYDEKEYKQTAVLHIDKQENMPVIFRINNSIPASLEQSIQGNYIFNKLSSDFDIKIPEGTNTIEFGITGVSAGYAGQKYFTVNKLNINAIKGKTYVIKVDKNKVGNVSVLKAHIEEK